ncbi:MAG: DUF3365 domain-containing protein, partial [Bdellovibrio sp.]
MDWFNSLGLKVKILSTVAFACLICAVIALITAIYFNEQEFRSGLIQKSRTIHSRLDVAAKYVANQGGLQTMSDRYVQKYQDSSQLTDNDKKVILQQVPIYAAMKIGAEDADKEQYKFRVFSNEPRRKENLATADEMEIFKKFEADPSLGELVSDSGDIITVYRPVRLRDSLGCMTCHGHPSKSPWGNGKDTLGYPMEDWKDGRLHGVFAISNDVNMIKSAGGDNVSSNATIYLGVFVAIGGILALGLATLIMRKPLAGLQQVVKALGESGHQVSGAAEQISESAQGLSQATSIQA